MWQRPDESRLREKLGAATSSPTPADLQAKTASAFAAGLAQVESTPRRTARRPWVVATAAGLLTVLIILGVTLWPTGQPDFLAQAYAAMSQAQTVHITMGTGNEPQVEVWWASDRFEVEVRPPAYLKVTTPQGEYERENEVEQWSKSDQHWDPQHLINMISEQGALTEISTPGGRAEQVVEEIEREGADLRRITLPTRAPEGGLAVVLIDVETHLLHEITYRRPDGAESTRLGWVRVEYDFPVERVLAQVPAAVQQRFAEMATEAAAQAAWRAQPPSAAGAQILTQMRTEEDKIQSLRGVTLSTHTSPLRPDFRRVGRLTGAMQGEKRYEKWKLLSTTRAQHQEIPEHEEIWDGQKGASIYPERSGPLTGPAGASSLLQQLGLTHGGKMISAWLEQSTVTQVGEEEIDGRPCVVLQVEAGYQNEYRLWLGPALGYRLVRMQGFFPDGSVNIDLRYLDFREYPGGLWLPQRSETDAWRDSGEHVAHMVSVVEKLEVNGAVPDSLFVVPEVSWQAPSAE